MSIAVLLRNEWIKMARRPAFLVSTGVFTGLITLIYTAIHLERRNSTSQPPFTLPDGWTDVFEPAILAAFFAAVALILLVTGEFSWRTARQNVIDGLSKEQFFAGKLLLLPILVLLFYALHVGIAGGIALLGTPAGTESVLRARDAGLLAGFLLLLAGYGSLALMLAIVTRGSGPAIAVFFLYVGILEMILRKVLGVFGEEVASIGRLLPSTVFNTLVEPAQYDASLVARALAAAAASGRTPPELLPVPALFALAAGWSLVFIATAFLVFRSRDL